jgi:hypothetical protein
MKKIIIFSLLLSLISLSYAGNGLFNISLDVNGTLDKDIPGGSISSDVDPGYSLVSEISLPVRIKGFKLGIGTEYQFPRDVDSGGSVNFWNTYIILKKNLINNRFNTLTPVFKIGTSKFDADDDWKATGNPTQPQVSLKDGIFYSFGLYYKLRGLAFAEISYSVSKTEYSYLGNDYDVEYKKINFTWGTRFDAWKNKIDKIQKYTK